VGRVEGNARLFGGRRGSDDWAELDEVLASERHTAVHVRPMRVYSSPGRLTAPKRDHV